MSRAVSIASMLTEEERKLCHFYVALDGQQPSEIWRRAHNDDTISAKECARLLNGALKRPMIAAYIAELRQPDNDAARAAMAQEVKTGGRGALRAAEKILEDEDKLGFRDAVVEWARIMCEVGAEIEVPLPTTCQSCGAAQRITVPMADLFPRISDAQAPAVEATPE